MYNLYEIYHYGVKRRSGRYPYGSGERPYQSGNNKFSKVNKNLKHDTETGVKTSTYKTLDGSKTTSKAKLYDFGMKGFNWNLIADVETSKDYRRRGLSKTIIQQIKEDSKDKGLYLMVKTNNEPAIKLYESENFKKLKTYTIDNEDYYIMTDEKFDTTIFKNMNFS